MRSQKAGKNISTVEVESISPHGLWLYASGSEYFLPFEDYPWFKNAKVADIQNVELLHDYHLYWPNLDVDLELESLERPDQYPLAYK